MAAMQAQKMNAQAPATRTSGGSIFDSVAHNPGSPAMAAAPASRPAVTAAAAPAPRPATTGGPRKDAFDDVFAQFSPRPSSTNTASTPL
ncbi:hypothetical protein H696_06327, partial [Fonticula alba]